MRKIIVQEFLTLDGVMQAPGGPEEDTSGGFPYGGWVAPYFNAEPDPVFDRIMQKWMQSTDILIGKNTFQIFEPYWPKHAEDWLGINEVNKYVLSTSLERSDWQNTVFVRSIDEVINLKASGKEDLRVYGSAAVAQALFKHNLVDELYLMIFPIILGRGKRLFAEDSMPAAFAVTDHQVTSNGVVLSCYQRVGEVKTGLVGE
ncbi:dihydrofolate reductase family protein [Acinetobacter variabilis]|uniref:Dihydrofolate reductase family protein n=1 Tax=Acinetobacter variabilis TaxID=70346 RepID=A0A7T7WIC3_9GAMM|nr:dihydrofolate reductase family protein [Acinetobacter variabilis]QQN87706.1 dihydrofolate reductase family protein [Acinetobacter variabilis]